MKYLDTKVVFAEIPDEITLAINITNCPCKCEDCHSSYLSEDIGEELTVEVLFNLIEDNEGISCISFMGGDSNPKDVNNLAKKVKERFNFKVAWYSGKQELSKDIDLKYFDFIKLGDYKKELGPLYSRKTNQRMYKVCNGELEDITKLFWK